MMQRAFVLVALIGSCSAVTLKAAEKVHQAHVKLLEEEGFVGQTNLHKGKSGEDDHFVDMLRTQYLETTKRGILGMLNHGAYTDPTRGGTTDPDARNECMALNFERTGVVDNCIMKWDAYERLSRIEDLYKKIREQDVPGDLMECGVWRGGITVYMKALLRAHGDEGRKVWVSDSFNGVPNAMQTMQNPLFASMSKEMQQMDVENWGGNITETDLTGKFVVKNFLTVENELVKDNFERFNLLDEGVKFLPGYFNESLPKAGEAGVEQLALLRVDGDLYSSTLDVLNNLYDKVSPGGFIVFDDWPLPESRRAILDFFNKTQLDEKLLQHGPRITVQHTRYAGDMDNINEQAWFQKPYK